ncbi:DUF2303 family protein [Pseudomethylobacillus aquaticus]|nr:DUF2303 family protein [Pseudomethylobacillus aquaticus]
MDKVRTEADAVAEITRQPRVEHIEGVPYLLMPASNGGWDWEPKEALLAAPLRKSGTVHVHDADSFIMMAKRHGSLADAVIYVDVDYTNNKVQATAVYNDHGDQAGWRDHTTVFMPRQTEEWRRWNKNNKKTMSQVEFANYLEQNIQDIHGGDDLPTGSDVLTFVSSLQETRKVKYGSAINLQNGTVQIEFIEDGEKAQKGKLELFREFAVGAAPFFGGTPFKVRAFLRYRIDRNTGEIVFWYELQRADKVLEEACKEMIERIKGESGLPVVYGTP